MSARNKIIRSSHKKRIAKLSETIIKDIIKRCLSIKCRVNLKRFEEPKAKYIPAELRICLKRYDETTLNEAKKTLCTKSNRNSKPIIEATKVSTTSLRKTVTKRSAVHKKFLSHEEKSKTNLNESKKPLSKEINKDVKQKNETATKHIPVYKNVKLIAKEKKFKQNDPYEMDISPEEHEKKPLPKKKTYTKKKKPVLKPSGNKSSKRKYAKTLIIDDSKLIISNKTVTAGNISSHDSVPLAQLIKTNKPYKQFDPFTCLKPSRRPVQKTATLPNVHQKVIKTIATTAVPTRAQTEEKPCDTSANHLTKSKPFTASLESVYDTEYEEPAAHNEDQLFGFEEDLVSSDEEISFVAAPRQKTNEPVKQISEKINVRSNVLLRKSFVNNTRQNISNNLSALNTSEEGSPWRLNFSACKRNVTERNKRPAPRDTAPVISTPKVIQATPKKQKTLTSFFSNAASTKTPEKQNDAAFSVSLYGDFIDAYKLSPVKSKENIPLTAKQHLSNKRADIENIENYFGFDRTADSCDSQISLRARSTPLKELNTNSKLPMRFPFKHRQIANLKKPTEKTTTVPENDDSVILVEEKNLTIPEENSTVEQRFALFEDPEVSFIEPTRRSYKFKPRKRYTSYNESEHTEDDDDDDDNDDDEHHDKFQQKPIKKKRKNAKELAREEEYNRWAQQFNSMCDEVDKHELIVE